ncbi:GntR family transcriptional regulator [Rhizobiaceae bacterium BDR2-2]|uniref:GntR family transcriptional regulator n=1 Tax=Ectorhizobium quercum TaxID=2965071 RepID=A0AAE3N3Q9_9HYPH|nr:GntR family transcriptional regulator [Ectorhizobium quercum]MCX8997952.1 GntR family transcriptional regulator [Ectorhizobium quercum]
MEPSFKHQTLSDALLNEIREAILSGKYPAGQQLRQDRLATEYGVSRIPIREALFQLEAEGLVRIVPRRGAVVSELSALEIDDVFELRLLLETRLFRRSAPLLTDDDIEQVKDIEARYRQAIEQDRASLYGELNAELHSALYKRADLPRTGQMVASLLQTSERYTRIHLSSPEALTRAIREHVDLIRLVERKEFDKAEQALEAHIRSVHTDLLKVAASER